MKKHCNGVKLSGQYRGAPCNARPVFEVRGRPYCVSHASIAAKAPRLFREAIETAVRRRVRQEAAARYREAQIDAFPQDAPMNSTIIEGPTSEA